MKVILNAIEDNNASQKITCNWCGSVLEITPDDLGKVKSDFRDGDYYNVVCPVCKNTIYLPVDSLNKDMRVAGYARSRRRE